MFLTGFAPRKVEVNFSQYKKVCHRKHWCSDSLLTDEQESVTEIAAAK